MPFFISLLEGPTASQAKTIVATADAAIVGAFLDMLAERLDAHRPLTPEALRLVHGRKVEPRGRDREVEAEEPSR